MNAGLLFVAVQFEQRGSWAGFQTAVFGLLHSAHGSSRTLPVVISETGIGLGQAWELRTSGLWAEQIREQPFVHWSYGLEAFALAVDNADELVRQGHGYRVPLGWELDFVASDDPLPFAGSDSGTGSFRQRGDVEGLLLTGDGKHPIVGRAERSFWSGSAPPHSIPAKLEHRAVSQPGAVVLPTMNGPWTVGHDSLLEPGGVSVDRPSSG